MATGRKKKPRKVVPTKRQTRVDRAAVLPPNGFWLAAHMQRREISAEKLAQHLGVERQTVWKWQVGEAEPDIETRNRIAAFLEVTEPELWTKPGFVDLNAAAAHIKDERVRRRFAEMLKNYPSD